MFIEKFITSYVRKKNADYLTFSPSTFLSVPERRDTGTPCLLYIHVPFCEQLCPYCSFNRVVFQEKLARSYFQALRKELVLYNNAGYDFRALYVGGGTPTVLIDELAETLGRIRELFHVSEISVETNPNHLTPGNVEILKKSGVNRLSVGVQSFDDTLLRAVERYHKYGSGQEITERLAAVMGVFDTLNVDMIFNFPSQTMEILEKDLSILTGLAVDQVTYYPLMVSSYTQDQMRSRLGEVDYDRGKAFYMKIVERLGRSYHPSTAWCFSRNTAMIDEYVVNYDEYAGLGSGSIGYLGGCVYANTFDIPDYIDRVERGLFPITAKKECSRREQLRYEFLMKLFGLHLDLKGLRRKGFASIYYYLWPEIFFFALIGGLTSRDGTLYLTKEGQYYWVLMMREFFVAVNNFRDYCRAQAAGLSKP
jgi:coproporphyrinogen III oxidase-like Fe-S oxidoreductase